MDHEPSKKLRTDRGEECLLVQTAHNRWLESTIEEPLEPDLAIIDPHHHLWDKLEHRPFVYRYMLDEIGNDCISSGHNIAKTVYMQSSRAGWSKRVGPEHLRVVGEVEVMQGIAAMADSGRYGSTGVCAGIIGTVDLMMGAAKVEEALLAHMAAGRNFRGIRYMGGQAERIPFSDEEFRAGVAVIERLGLVLDINGPETHPLMFKSVLGAISELARAYPRLTVVVNHCGGAIGPACSNDKQLEWQEGLKSLRACPNIFMKVGGLQMAVNGFPLGSKDRAVAVTSEELLLMTRPFYEHVIRVFGPDRCMFESNFPVDKSGVSYNVLWNMFKKLSNVLELSAEEKALIFYGTAAKVYKLD